MSNLTEGSALKVDDLKSQAEPFLTEKTKKALENKATQLIKWRANDKGEAYASHKVLYIAKKVKISQVEEGIKFVAEKINALGEADKIESALSHFLKFDLYNQDISSEQECVILCYPMVDVYTYEEVMKDRKTHGAIVEGEMPE